LKKGEYDMDENETIEEVNIQEIRNYEEGGEE
jgi:hypothetical protein